jgi:ketosteroid isomerase-like protein
VEESTTPDLVERTRRAVEAFNRRDWDAAMAFYTPDAVWDMSALGVGVFDGSDAIRGFFDDWLAAYEDFKQVLEEVRHFGNRVTLGLILQRARLPGSDGLVEFRYAAVGTWVNGLIERVTAYTDIDEARAAAERLAQERG